MTTKAYISRQGGTHSKSLMKEATFFFHWAKRHLASVRAEHLTGVRNLAADWLSRQDLSEGEWSLHPAAFKLVMERFSLPILDLFASQDSAQTPRFFSRSMDSGAEGTDALTMDWLPGLLCLSSLPPPPEDTQADLQTGGRSYTDRPSLAAPPLVSSTHQPTGGTVTPLPNRLDLLQQGQLVHPNPGLL